MTTIDYSKWEMRDLIKELERRDRREEENIETDWNAQAEQDGKSLASDIEEKIQEAVRVYRDSKEGDKDEAAETIEYDNDDTQSIFDDLYQEEDTYYRASEYADGHFIYNSTSALIDAMKCIDQLDNYSSGDSGLWEGKTEYWDIINIQATDAYRGAVHSYAEDAIKERINELLNV